ncbi:MAG: hypothetical protein HY367_03910 [Candidatus Aenigmarchaeota archaeon]|nr:hypothetical protein [Candidatus Aenigmarchaeota archaeon]
MKHDALFPVSSSTKEQIIAVLSGEWPLSARKVYTRLLKKHNISLTYQAVHKALRELTESSILEREGTGYRLAEAWIAHLGNFSQKMKDEYDSVHVARETRALHRFVFTKHSDFVRFHLDLARKLLESGKQVKMTFHMRHVIYPFLLLAVEEHGKFKELLGKSEWVILSKNATAMDEWCAKYWRRLGVKVTLGADVATNSILIVTNDYITDARLPKKALGAWDKLFESVNVKNFDANRMNEIILEQKFETVATVFRDRKIADMLA